MSALFHHRLPACPLPKKASHRNNGHLVTPSISDFAHTHCCTLHCTFLHIASKGLRRAGERGFGKSAPIVCCCRSHFSLLWSQTADLILKQEERGRLVFLELASELKQVYNFFESVLIEANLTSKNCLNAPPPSSEAPTTIPACTVRGP